MLRAWQRHTCNQTGRACILTFFPTFAASAPHATGEDVYNRQCRYIRRLKYAAGRALPNTVQAEQQECCPRCRRASIGIKGDEDAVTFLVFPSNPPSCHLVTTRRCHTQSGTLARAPAGMFQACTYLQVRRMRERDRLQLRYAVHLPACQGHPSCQPRGSGRCKAGRCATRAGRQSWARRTAHAAMQPLLGHQQQVAALQERKAAHDCVSLRSPREGLATACKKGITRLAARRGRTAQAGALRRAPGPQTSARHAAGCRHARC